MLAIKTRPAYIKVIKNPSREMIEIALQGDIELIKYFQNLVENEIIKLIQKLKYNTKDISHCSTPVLYFLDNPTEKIQLEAIKKDWRNINYILNPTKEMIAIAEKNKSLEEELRPCVS